MKNNLKYTINLMDNTEYYNPREENNNLGKMICFHRKYNLGDNHNYSIAEAQELETSKNIISLPLYLFDHTDITISTKPFYCPFDSGKVGFIYISYEDVYKEYNVTRISKKLREKILHILQEEVLIYDQYIRGEIYEYEIYDDRDIIDIVGGFFNEEDAKQEAKISLAQLQEQAYKESYPLFAHMGFKLF